MRRHYIWSPGRRVGIRVGVRQLGTPAGCCKSGRRHSGREELAELGSNSAAMAQNAHSHAYLFRPNNTHPRLSDKPAMQIYPCPSGRRSKARRDSTGETRGKGLSLWELGQTPGETSSAWRSNRINIMHRLIILKGIGHLHMNVRFSFNCVITDLYDFRSSVEHNRRNFAEPIDI